MRKVAVYGPQPSGGGTLHNAAVDRTISQSAPGPPIMTMRASHFFSDLVRQSIEQIGVVPAKHQVFADCGHSLALEQPGTLAEALIEFFANAQELTSSAVQD